MTHELQHWINGSAQASSGSDRSSGTNPATGGPTVDLPRGTVDDVDSAVRSAQAASSGWRYVASLERGRTLAAIAAAIRSNADELREVEKADTGKPDALLDWEIENSATYFDYYAALVNLPVGDVIDTVPEEHAFTRREPFGVVAIVTPWNLPLNQAARACAPALAAGNSVVLKPAHTSSQSSVLLARLASAAGLPDGVLNVVVGSGSAIGDAIVSHPLVRKVAFTGSVGVGQRIGRLAAEKVIPLTLELGGKSANIVFGDADLEVAARESVRGFLTNAGQVCSAGTRLLVHSSVHDELVARVAELTRQHVRGENLGPMITRDQFDLVHQYLGTAEREGAVPVTGGEAANRAVSGPGFYVEPTVYDGVDNGMTIAREEVFGPVLSVITFEDEDEAVRLANDSDFGLVAAVWTADISRAFRVSRQLEAGQVFVNTWSTASVQTPFGGQKLSGYGREKGIEGLLSYTQLKSIIISYAH